MSTEAQVKEGAPETEAMRELVQGDKLRCGDILLVHRKRKLVSRIIRALTGSYWNHVAIMYGSECCDGCPHKWVIEALASGVEIRRIEEYFNSANLEVADIGIKRLEADWFSKGHKEHFGYLLLQEVGKRYDYKLLFKLFVYAIISRPLRFLRLSLLSPFSSFFKFLSRTTPEPVAHICSGLAQWAYCQMARQEKGAAAALCGVWEEKDKEKAILKSVTPGDIANTDGFSWKYLIKGGRLWEVKSGEEVKQILGSKQ